MSQENGRFPMLEHCCYGFSKKEMFPAEAALFYSALKSKYGKTKFFDGNLIEEEKILNLLEKDIPKKIFYYIYTTNIRKKKEFMKRLSEISKLYLVIMPFFWKEKILREFPFVEDVFYDGEKGEKVDVENVITRYEDFELKKYIGEGSFSVVLSKYCPYQCTYCNARKTGLMERDLNIVKEEIIYLKKRGIKKFRLCGNNLTINKKRFIDTCNMMKELNVEWSGDGRVNHMTKEMYDALENSGGTILFGIESANQKILNKIKKGIALNQIIEVADELNKRKIPFRYTFMFGFPDDNYRTFKEMISLRKKVNALNYQCSLLSAYPGTILFEQMKEMKLVDENQLDFGDFDWAKLPLAPTLYLSKEEIKKLVKKIMVHGVFNKGVIRNILKTRKIKEYPKIFSRGLRLLVRGRRTWKD